MRSITTERDVRAVERRLDALLASGADDGEVMRAYEAYDRTFQRLYPVTEVATGGMGRGGR